MSIANMAGAGEGDGLRFDGERAVEAQRTTVRTARFDSINGMFIVVATREQDGICASLHVPTPHNRTTIAAMTHFVPPATCEVLVADTWATLWVDNASFRLRDVPQAKAVASFIGQEVRHVPA